MRITIKQKLLPFSHRPGVRCLIANTTWEAEIFPTKAVLRNLSGEGIEEIPLPFGGRFEGFTVLQNLERGRIEVFTKGKGRFFIDAESHPTMQKIEQPPSNKRLSLGIHKKQDWDLIARRGDMAEIFPFWLRQAELVPDSPLKSIGTAQLLSEGKLEHFFHAGFQGILSPRYKDENFLGLVKEIDEPKISPLGLLHEGARQIGRLFFREEEGKLSFLPSLPKQFHAGRFIHLMTKDGDRIDFEWTKKELKKVIIYPAKTHSIQLGLQRSLKSFRVRTNLRARGERCDRNATLELKPNQVLYIDRFTH